MRGFSTRRWAGCWRLEVGAVLLQARSEWIRPLFFSRCFAFLASAAAWPTSATRRKMLPMKQAKRRLPPSRKSYIAAQAWLRQWAKQERGRTHAPYQEDFDEQPCGRSLLSNASLAPSASESSASALTPMPTPG
jgi:hypothetical protein